MKSLGQAGSGMPRTRTGDHDRALSLLAAMADPKATKKSLIELRDAQMAADEAREAAEATMAAATKRDTMAREAEADATRARQALADETEKARVERSQRESAIAEREKAQHSRDLVQESREQDLSHREKLLREAGVAGF